MTKNSLLFGTTSRREAVVHALTHCVRLLSDAQTGRLWFPGAKSARASARSLFRALAHQELVALHTAMIHPELELRGPELDFQPGDEPPHFGRLAFRLKSRWHAEPCRTVVARATRRARLLLGAPLGGRPIRFHEIAHDLGVATVFFRLVATSPESAKRWRHEDELIRSSLFVADERRPDAVLVGSPQVIVEFGGQYSAVKLRGLHAAYQHSPYQIW